MKSDIEGEVLKLIDKRRDAIIKFLKDLICFPSVTGDELEIQKFIARKLESMGLAVNIWEPDHEELKDHPAYVLVERGYTNRPNVVGMYKGTGNGKSLLFNGHVDVIPPGPLDAWEHQPWAGDIEGNRLYGRGASDMKSGLAAMTMALDSLIRLNIRLKGDVILEYTVDEELSGNGTLACVMKGYQADAGICCESSSLHVQPACIGRVWFEISVRGKPAGIQRRWEGVNAIEKGYSVVQAVSNFEDIRINELKHPLYPDNRSALPCMVGVFQSGSFPSAFPVDFQHSSVFIKFNEDGSANLVVSACDFGQGVLASLGQIAAEELGIRAEDIRIVSGNTDITMYDTGQYSSRSCYIIGNSVLGAARLAKQRLLERAAQIIGIPAGELDVKDRQIYVKKTGEKKISVAEVTWQAMYNADNFSNISAKYAWQPTSNAFPFQAAFAEVEVDTESGGVKILKVVAAQDVGRAINPITVEGQVEGGGLQAVDWALYSDFVTNPVTGVLESINFTNYKVCTTLDIPEFEVILIEEPTPTGPFGAKSVGESGTIAIAPAIYNAIYDAVGVRVKDMPVTPEKIIEGLLALVDRDTG